ncbi:hypothetical protein BC834DRAFT_910734 [Gloeopeniophorella convolvens]|nr:hypothetical protein BC834DRAFT_910734 [Gloeopeniophorella convolvens]
MLQHSTTAAYVGVQSSSVIIRGCPMDPCTGRERMLFQAKFTFDTVASFERLLPVMQLIFSRIETLILGVDVGVRFPSSSFQAIGVYDARLWCALLTKAAFNAATCVRMDSYVMPSVLWALQISEDFRFPPNMHEVRLDLSARFIERPASAWVELFRNYFHPSVDISHNLYTKENWAYRHSDCGAPTTQQ